MGRGMVITGRDAIEDIDWCGESVPKAWVAEFKANREFAQLTFVGEEADYRTDEAYWVFESPFLPDWQRGAMPFRFDSFSQLIVHATRQACLPADPTERAQALQFLEGGSR